MVVTARALFRELQAKGPALILGVANEKSFQGFVRVLGFRSLGRLSLTLHPPGSCLSVECAAGAGGRTPRSWPGALPGLECRLCRSGLEARSRFGCATVGCRWTRYSPAACPGRRPRPAGAVPAGALGSPLVRVLRGASRGRNPRSRAAPAQPAGVHRPGRRRSWPARTRSPDISPAAASSCSISTSCDVAHGVILRRCRVSPGRTPDAAFLRSFGPGLPAW